jgi:predicted outer membrane repeat protein
MSTKTVILVISVIAISPCFARTIIVDDNGPADFNNIQAAINDSNNGDTVLVQPGIYTGNGNRDIDFLGKAIVVRSADPNNSDIIANTIVDCGGTNHRGFRFTHSEGRNSILEGLTITGASIQVMCEAGAGVYINGASSTIKKCIVINNHAELDPMSLCYCYGGGIYIGNGSNPLVVDCVINENSVGDFGWGGGIYCAFNSQATIRNCLISSNTAIGYDSRGGGIYCESSCILTLVNCTIADNLASQGCGGIYFDMYNSPVKTVTNSILWGNSPGQIYPSGNASIVVTYSDVSGGWPGTGNINADPRFANTGDGDYHLRSQAGRWNPNTQSWVKDFDTSPCIDAGDPNSDWPAELWPNDKRINMGAYGGTPQASMSLSEAGNIANLDNDPCDIIDFNDLKVFAEKWCYEENLLAEDLDRNGHVDFKDFTIFGREFE